MRQIAWSNIPGKLDEAWRRFRDLSWRWKAPALSVAALCALAAACGSETMGVVVPSPRATTNPASPPADSPAPAPTPVEGAYKLVEELPSATFDRMVGFALIPGAGDEAAVITQHSGQVWRVFLDGAEPQLMGDISDRLISDPANEEGLLGIAFSPDLRSHRRLYLYYTADTDCPPGFSRCSVLSRFPVAGDVMDLDREEVLLKLGQPRSNHNGGDLHFGPDGYLYVALGDGGGAGDPDDNAQDLSTLLGSILRLDVSGGGYAVPADNPFGSEIYAYGLRNPWRFSFDRETGDLWAADVGQERWEEIDLIKAGGNYGWPIMEAFECFRPSSCDDDGLELPRAAYGHALGCSVTGGYVYRGPSMPELDGWYVFGDFCSGKIWAVNTVGSAAPVLLADTGLPIASFAELPDGELVVVTFANAIYRLARSP